MCLSPVARGLSAPILCAMCSKRNLKRTDTWIEERIFEQVKRYIADCSRSRVLLTAEEARKLPAEYERRAAIEFRISDEALRRSYLENVRINRVVVAAFAKQQAPPTQRA